MLNASGDVAISKTFFAPNQPSQEPILNDVSAGFSSIVQIAKNVLINPDIAYRTDRMLQTQMEHDPMIMGPLIMRKLSVSQLEWEIVPEDEDGEHESPTAIMENKPFFPSLGGNVDAKAMAKKVESVIRRMAHRNDFFKHLLWADWRGTGASELDWQFDGQDGTWFPASPIPHHGDSITFDVFGNPRILTRLFQTGGRELTKDEKDRLVIHTFQPDMGFFYKGEEAGFAFKGRGLRDICWPYWWLAHNAIRFWTRFIQRYGMGFALGKYRMGNAQQKNAIESVLKNMIEDALVSVPTPDGAEGESFGIELMKMEGLADSASLFKGYIEEWAGRHIRIVLLGQDQINQEGGDGLGSGRADALKDYGRMVRDDSAQCLADTLTQTLVQRVQRFNYGFTNVRLKFQFILEKTDYEGEIGRLKSAKELGAPVAKSVVYKALDIPQPGPEEEVFEFSQGQTGPAGLGALTGAPGLDEFDADTHRLFSSALGEVDKEKTPPQLPPGD